MYVKYTPCIDSMSDYTIDHVYNTKCSCLLERERRVGVGKHYHFVVA